MRRTIPRALAVIIIGVLAAVWPGATTASALAQAAGPTATFAKTSDWGSGFEAKYTITNDGTTALSSWKVEFDLPSPYSIGSHWEADLARSGNHYTFTNKGWNGTLAPGASTSFGFIGSPGGLDEPENCQFNGASCGGEDTPPDDTEAPSTPGNLRVTGTTSNSVSLAWTASTDNEGVTGYVVFRNGEEASTVTGTSYTDPGLRPDTQYTYTVRARDAAGNRSGASNQVTARTQDDDDPPPTTGAKRVAYFTQWGIYGRNFKVAHVDRSGAAGKLTHVNYAFGNVNQQGRCFMANQTGQGDAWADYQHRVTAADSVDGQADRFDQPLAGNFNQLKKLKAKHPGLKVLISLGGWTWSKYFSNAALTAESRRAFAESCIDLFIKGNLPKIGGEPQGGPGSGAGVFDGIDLDWEWPASEGAPGNVIRPEDKRNFTLLLAEVRRQLDAYGSETGKRYELTAFLPAAAAKIDAGFEVSNVFNRLDFATVQGYDLRGAWENQTGHQSNLFSNPADPTPEKYSVNKTVQKYVAEGAPRSKIVIGVPAYGRGWTGVPSTNNGLYQSSSGSAPGTWEAGIEDYKVLKNRSGQRFRDTTHGAFWLYDGTQFWSYDDPQLLTQKANWIKDEGLGGSMMWSLDGDDAQASLTTALWNVLR